MATVSTRTLEERLEALETLAHLSELANQARAGLRLAMTELGALGFVKKEFDPGRPRARGALSCLAGLVAEEQLENLDNLNDVLGKELDTAEHALVELDGVYAAAADAAAALGDAHYALRRSILEESRRDDA